MHLISCIGIVSVLYLSVTYIFRQNNFNVIFNIIQRIIIIIIYNDIFMGIFTFFKNFRQIQSKIANLNHQFCNELLDGICHYYIIIKIDKVSTFNILYKY